MSVIIDFIAGLGLEMVKDKIIDQSSSREIQERIRNYLKRQSSLNFYVSLEEEIDFEGLSDYIRGNMIEDIKMRCFGNKRERGMARESLVSKARIYASVKTDISTKRAIKIVTDIADVLYQYYRSKANRELLFIAGEIEDSIQEEHVKTRELVISKSEHLEDMIRNNTALSIDNSLKQIAVGDIKDVENNLGSYMNAISAKHTLFPYFGFRMTKENKITSVALTEDAKIKYPEKFKITASNVKLGHRSITDTSSDILEQAYRHQLPIYIEVKNAQKYLGDFLDPIQREAEEMVGTTAIMKPPEFPKAFPCCVKIGEEIIAPYILLRLKEILDNEILVITNDEQKNFPFRIVIKISPSTSDLTFTITPSNPSNKESLMYKKFLKRVMDGVDVSVWLLEENQRFLHGIVEYSTDEDLDDEIDFLEKITTIEEYFSERIDIPETVTRGEWNVVIRLYNLINGEYRGSMDKVNFTFELSDENRERFLELTDQDYVIAYTAEGVFSVFDKEFVLPIFREYQPVKIDNLERLKKKVDILDNGDQLKLVYVPGTNKKTCNYVDKIRTKEIESGLLFSKNLENS
ncbi:MAG: hypothetical protein ACLUTC_12315 [Anaerobutyricum hallii]